MRQTGTETEQKPKHALWYGMLTVVLPFFSLLLSVAFVLFCRTYGSIRRSVTIELGEESPGIDAFLRKSDAEAEFVAAPEPRYSTPGSFSLRVRANGRTVPVVLRVKDTQPPTAYGIETTVPTMRALTPDKLIRDLKDQSVVKVTYETKPDFYTVGDYEALILLEDTSGNVTHVRSTVHVRTAREELVLEAGSPVPQANAFLFGTYEKTEMTPIGESVMHEPGEYPIHITADGIAAESLLIVRDTIAPEGRGTTYIALPGETVTPEMLVTDITDETAVTVAFAAPPDPESLDSQTIGVILSDRGGNETTVYSTLLFSNVKPVVLEARTAPLAVSELLAEGTYTEAALDMRFVPDDPGQHVLAVTVDGKRNLALVEVRDTIAPEIKISLSKWYLTAPTAPETFAKASDITKTTLTFAAEPDWTKEQQEVTVIATDTSGNRSEKTFTLKLRADTEPPKLYGVRDRYCYVGEPVVYFSEVSAWDDCDGAVEATVDASSVDSERTGAYPVTYSATDKAGNTFSKTVQFRFVTPTVDEQRAQAVADKVIAQILTDDMTLAEQVEAIYDYVFTHVHYVARSNEWDWRSEAVRGLTTGKGDCFTAYASARLLLEQTDAQILSVDRLSDVSHHSWMFVNIGTGWYHFDACNAWTGKKRCFMWTDAQTRRISKTYWRYDKSLYPPIATEPYDGGN